MKLTEYIGEEIEQLIEEKFEISTLITEELLTFSREVTEFFGKCGRSCFDKNMPDRDREKWWDKFGTEYNELLEKHEKKILKVVQDYLLGDE